MDLLIRNADLVLTPDGVRSGLDIAITEGRISGIWDSNRSGEQPPAAEEPVGQVVDGRGRAVVPGWKNAHTHAAMTLLRGYADDMRLQPWLQEAIWPMEARLTPEDIYWGTRLAALEMIRGGTTFANDMYFNTPEVSRAFRDAGLRAGVGLAMFDFGDSERRAQLMDEVDQLLDEWQRDRTDDDNRMPLVRPVIAPHSVYTCSGELLQWAAQRAEDTGLVFHIHMNETRQEVDDCLALHGRRPFEWLDTLGVLDRIAGRGIAAHGIWLDESEIRLAAAAGITIAHNPASNMKLGSGVLDWQALRDAGIPLMLGPDGVASNNSLDMFDEMRLAALLQKVHSGDPTRLTAHEAVTLATGGLSAVFVDHGLSSGISIGAAADLQLIDLDTPQLVPLHNLESHLVYAANASVVDSLIVGGRLVMSGRAVPDAEDVIAEARRCATRLTHA